MNKLLLAATALSFIIVSCNQNTSSEEIAMDNEPQEYGNPAAPGFNVTDSDPEAIAIADTVMMAMGGREAWDTLRYYKWNFFGRRDLVWDKQTGNVRIEAPYDSILFLVNVEDETGRVFIKGEELTEPDSLQKMLSMGKSIWINDSYWLFMPFKLKDSGVTLKHVRQDTIPGGGEAEVLELTFDSVGVTPQNKYEVYVDRSDNLVKQWAFFANAGQDAPSAVWPWDNYNEIGPLKLSFDRSDDRGPKDVMIFAELPEEVFSSPEDGRWSEYERIE